MESSANAATHFISEVYWDSESADSILTPIAKASTKPPESD